MLSSYCFHLPFSDKSSATDSFSSVLFNNPAHLSTKCVDKHLYSFTFCPHVDEHKIKMKLCKFAGNKSVLIADVTQTLDSFPQWVRQLLLSALLFQSLRFLFLETVQTEEDESGWLVLSERGEARPSCSCSRRCAAVTLSLLPVLRPERCDVSQSISQCDIWTTTAALQTG